MAKVNGCYARVLDDCRGPISREHYVSDAVLALFDSPTIDVSGVAWLSPGEVRRIPIAGLVSNVLCERHNSLLSPADEFAREFFDLALDPCRDVPKWPTGRRVAFDGRGLERWLLKLMCGVIAGANFAHPEPFIQEQWVTALFARRPWPPEYVLIREVAPEAYTVPTQGHMHITPRFGGVDGDFQGLRFAFMYLDVVLAVRDFGGWRGDRRPTGWGIRSERGAQYDLALRWNA